MKARRKYTRKRFDTVNSYDSPSCADAEIENALMSPNSQSYSAATENQSAISADRRRDTILMVLLSLSLLGGIGLGIILNSWFKLYMHQVRYKKYVVIPGNLSLRLLKMILIPLVVCSNISSMATMTLRATGWMSFIAIIGFIGSLTVSAGMGVVLAHIVGAGDCLRFKQMVNRTLSRADVVRHEPQDIGDVLTNLITNAVPDNVIQAAVEMTITQYRTEIRHITVYTSPSINATPETYEILVPDTNPIRNVNVLGMIFFSVTFGLTLHSLGEKRALLVELCQLVRHSMVKLLKIMMWFQPIGIVFLAVSHIAFGVPVQHYANCYAGYIVFMLSGVLMVFFCQFVALWLLARTNPFKFVWNAMPALLCAAGSSSTAATLPYTLYCLEKHRSGVDPRATRFLIPCASVMNKNGTALWLAFTSVLISNAAGLAASGRSTTIQVVGSVFYSMGASTTPSGGISMAEMLSMTLGLPTGVVDLLNPAEWLVDRFRTVNNVFGGMVMTAISSKFCRKELMRDRLALRGSLYNGPNELSAMKTLSYAAACPSTVIESKANLNSHSINSIKLARFDSTETDGGGNRSPLVSTPIEKIVSLV